MKSQTRIEDNLQSWSIKLLLFRWVLNYGQICFTYHQTRYLLIVTLIKCNKILSYFLSTLVNYWFAIIFFPVYLIYKYAMDNFILIRISIF